MKLFGIKDKHKNTLLPDHFFKEKKEAKTARDVLNKESPGTFVVSYGPDHKKYKH